MKAIRTAIVWAVVVFVCSLVFWRVLLLWDVASGLAQVRAAGLPTSGQELNDYYTSVPDDKNAALVVTQAAALAWEFSDGRTKWEACPYLDYRAQWSDKSWMLVASNLAMNEASLAKAQEGAQRPGCRYPVDFSTGLERLLPHLAQVKGPAYKLCFRALLSTEQGRITNSADDIKLMLHLAATLDGEPEIISQKVRNAIVSLAAATTERMLNRSRIDENSAAMLAGEFAKTGSSNSLRTAMIAEQVWVIERCQMSWESDPFVRTLGHMSGILERELPGYLAAMKTNFALADSGPPASLKIGQFTEGLMDMVVNDATMKARCRLTQCALAAEQFRRAYNRVPQALSELVPKFLPAVPEDPFDGKPLRYQLLDDGYLIYSIGKDGRDDGGRERKFVAREYSEIQWMAEGFVPAAPAFRPGAETNSTPTRTDTYDITFTCRGH